MPKKTVTYDADGKPVAHVRSRKDVGPLHKLMLKACPPDPETGAKSIRVLANALGVSRQSLVAACARGQISVKRASAIVDLANGEVTLSDFAPYYLL